MATAEFLKRTLIVVGIALVPIVVWYLFDVILITIGAILIAILLRLAARPFVRWCKLPESIALVLSGIVLIGVMGGAAYLFGTQIASELHEVVSRADTAMKSITASLQKSDLGRLILSHMQGGNFSITAFVNSVFGVSANLLGGLVVTIITGFYLAAQPALYRSGLSKLFPPQWRSNANETIDDIANALQLWLLGQLLQMLLIGALSTLAVWLIGLPSPLALGVIAGVAEFIPYVGPILAAIPAVLVATTKGLDAVLWTIIAYIIIHQVEGNLLAPIIQRHMVLIPPAVGLLGIVAIGFAFGTIAVIFAAPIAVILFVLVKKLYIRDTLGEKTAIPGEEN
jgi:predicted PurR-regulated permease PerM